MTWSPPIIHSRAAPGVIELPNGRSNGSAPASSSIIIHTSKWPQQGTAMVASASRQPADARNQDDDRLRGEPMTAIALVIFTGFVLYVMVWSIKNGNARSIKDQTGIIRMRDPSGTGKADS